VGIESRTDQELVAAINRGDWSAFEPLYFRHRDWVYRLACRFTGEHAAALDVVQEAFAYLLTQFPGFRLTAKLTTFLYPVVKNTALAAKRRSRRLKFGETPEVQDASADPLLAMPLSELGELLKTLPEGQLEVLLMRVVDGMSVEETAAALGLAEGTVKSRLHHALEKLRGDARARKWFEE
jgi:RNA polymerase sigma-70 factor (ECF subfamily)